ncbi:DDRGK domain-containing protein 1-like [Gigantopelta aegis]|uniref:DDRGK domain-containing protein 1-like n=1 Tax=Gigantopelta aegis TaxID=1735272 RepID=UPI001B88CE9B|nr:DDRGK domain-containing protein 1-like [Gigantopelta aegis]
MAAIDPFIVYLVVAVVIAIILLVVSLVNKFSSGTAKVNNAARAAPRPLPAEGPPGVRRRVRRRMRVDRDDSDEDGFDPDNIDEEEDMFDVVAQPEGKVGAKKMKKLQEKAERKAMREQMEQEREDRKKREAEIERMRKKQAEKDKAEAIIKEEEEKRLQEEKKQREHEEYLLLKQQFTVDEEGQCDAEVDLSSESLLQEFIQYIKDMKVVMLEDLAAHFKLKTQDVIQRVQDLQAEGQLTGVIDDRGKFIYITMDELEQVAKYIRQHGRVSITELAQSSNRLIDLNPDNAQTHLALLSTVSS